MFSLALKACAISTVALFASACSSAPVASTTSDSEPNSKAVSLNLTTQTVESDFCDFDNAPPGGACRTVDYATNASKIACPIDTISPPYQGKSQWPSEDTWEWIPTCARSAFTWPAWSLSSVNYVWCKNRSKIDFGDADLGGGPAPLPMGTNDSQYAEVVAKAGQTIFELHANYEFPGDNVVVGTVNMGAKGPVEVRLEQGNEDGTWTTIAGQRVAPMVGHRIDDLVTEVRASVGEPGVPIRLVVAGAPTLAGEAAVYIARARLFVPTCVRDAQGACR